MIGDAALDPLARVIGLAALVHGGPRCIECQRLATHAGGPVGALCDAHARGAAGAGLGVGVELPYAPAVRRLEILLALELSPFPPELAKRAREAVDAEIATRSPRGSEAPK